MEKDTIFRISEKDIEMIVKDMGYNEEETKEAVKVAKESFTIPDWSEYVYDFLFEKGFQKFYPSYLKSIKYSEVIVNKMDLLKASTDSIQDLAPFLDLFDYKVTMSDGKIFEYNVFTAQNDPLDDSRGADYLEEQVNVIFNEDTDYKDYLYTGEVSPVELFDQTTTMVSRASKMIEQYKDLAE